MKNYCKGWHFRIGSFIGVAIVILFIALAGDGDKAEVDVCIVGRGTIEESILCSGKIRPVSEVSLSPDVSGEIVDLRVCEGSKVRRGDTLLKIRQDLYISMVEKARAAVGSLEAALLRQKANTVQARMNLERAEKLYEAAAISRAELESARTEMAMMEGGLTAAEYDAGSGRAALKEAMENLTKTIIISPANGTVSHLNVELGERVVGTSQMAGTEIMRIADYARMEVMAEVGENDVVKLKEGQSAEIEIDALKDMIFKGFVTKVANSSKIIGAGLGQVANFEVRIAVDTPSQQLRPGMSASSTIVTERRDSILKIPVSAIFIKDGKEYVWKLNAEERVSAVEIRTGIQDIGSIEVLEGLSENDRIVEGPHSAIGSLQENAEVRVRKK